MRVARAGAEAELASEPKDGDEEARSASDEMSAIMVRVFPRPMASAIIPP